MLARDIEMFIEHCGLKGLSTKTINSYEQTLRLFMQYMDEQGILLTEKITHLAIQDYIKSIKERGKYTVTTNPNSGNYPDRRVDFGKRVSDITINNYLRNLRVFFNWCVEEELILRSPVKKGDFVKVERKPLEFVSDEDFKRLLKSMNSASFSEYRDSIIIQLLLDTGMRVNECLLIEVTDLDMVKRCISLPADKTKITFTDREWEAVQAGAISDSKLMKILNSSKSDEIIKRAMPKASTTLSSAKLGKAQAMLANGYSYAEIAKACGVSESTIYDNLNK